MNSSNKVRPAWLLMGGLPLALLLVAGGLAPPLHTGPLLSPAKVAEAPPAIVQGQSFSVARGDSATASGLHPADILGIGGTVLIPCENLGLLCYGEDGVTDDINSLSYGDDFSEDDLPALQFSVDSQASGRSGTAVGSESQCNPAQAQADVFGSALDSSNLQELDGDGEACAGNEGYGLGLAESAATDNVDALARNPCFAVDLDCDGVPEAPIYLTLAKDSPMLALIGASTADILVTGLEYAPTIWADGEDQLGLATGDVIDGLCLAEDGDGLFDADDVLVLSLASNSPSLAKLSARPGDLLRASPLRRIVSASKLGLLPNDNVDAIGCTNLIPVAVGEETYLPLIKK